MRNNCQATQAVWVGRDSSRSSVEIGDARIEARRQKCPMANVRARASGVIRHVMKARSARIRAERTSQVRNESRRECRLLRCSFDRHFANATDAGAFGKVRERLLDLDPNRLDTTREAFAILEQKDPLSGVLDRGATNSSAGPLANTQGENLQAHSQVVHRSLSPEEGCHAQRSGQRRLEGRG